MVSQSPKSNEIPAAVPSWQPSRILDQCLELWFPGTCVFCGDDSGKLAKQSRQQTLLCDRCEQRFQPWQGPRCSRCGQPLPPEAPPTECCYHCRKRRLRFDSVVALGNYEDHWFQAVRRMKRGGFRPLTLAMADLLARAVSESTLPQPDWIVPIPMYWWRRLMGSEPRAETLARRVSERLQVRCRAMLACRRKVKKQGTLLPNERFANVDNAFRIRPGYALAGSNILLIDDILTTGATASSAASTLRRAGAGRIDIAVVARASGKMDVRTSQLIPR